jgi:hypothetical protein
MEGGSKMTKIDKLIKVAKQHAQIMHNIALDKLRREQEKHAKRIRKEK